MRSKSTCISLEDFQNNEKLRDVNIKMGNGTWCSGWSEPCLMQDIHICHIGVKMTNN